jgi:hypothetical protein
MADSPKIDWIRIAISSQLVMLIYFTIDNHIDLYPWNNLRLPSCRARSLAGFRFF